MVYEVGHFVNLLIAQNPELRDDIVDSSGMRLWYTPTLRTYDIATIMFGVQVDPNRLFAPPGLVTTVTGFCGSDCTNGGFPEDGVNVVGSLLHSHLAGTALSLRHFRDGEEIEPIEVNEVYP